MVDITIGDIVLYIVMFVSFYISAYFLDIILNEDEEDIEVKNKKRKTEKYPSITIAIPAYNEEKSVVRTIESVFKSNYPKDKLKVIVINDGSKDKTREYILRMKKKYDFKFIDKKKNEGKWKALNDALFMSDTKYFGVLDSDSEVERDSIKNIVEEFENSDETVSGITSLMRVKNKDKKLGKMQWLEYVLNIFQKTLYSKINLLIVLTGVLSVYNTNILKKLGGFREGYKTEDFELTLRLIDNNYKVKQSLNSYTYTIVPDKINALVKQRVRWYFGTILNIKDYKKMLFNKKYGELGYYQLPLMFFGGLIILMGTSLPIYYFLKRMYKNLKALYLSGFDITTFIKNYHFEIESNLLFYDYKMMYLMVFSLTLFLYFMFRAFYVHKIPKKYIFKIDTIIYLLLYIYIVAWSYVITYAKLLFKRGIKWR